MIPVCNGDVYINGLLAVRLNRSVVADVGLSAMDMRCLLIIAARSVG